jgi:hypothetical protein
VIVAMVPIATPPVTPDIVTAIVVTTIIVAVAMIMMAAMHLGDGLRSGFADLAHRTGGHSLRRRANGESKCPHDGDNSRE